MAALVQSFPQQSSTITMLQTRPSSAGGILQQKAQGQAHQYSSSTSQMHRNSFHGLSNGIAAPNYHGNTNGAPVAPYAFTGTPAFGLPGQKLQGPHLRLDQRTASAPVVPVLNNGEQVKPISRARYPAPPSVSTISSSSSDFSSLSNKSVAKDDSSISGMSSKSLRPNTTSMQASASSPNLALPAVSSPVKAVPDRYRRSNNRRADSSTGQPSPTQAVPSSNMPNFMQFYGTPTQQSSPAVPAAIVGSQALEKSPVTATDDMQLNRSTVPDASKRYRRRSIHTIDVSEYGHNGANALSEQLQGSRQVSSAHGRIDHQQQHPLRSSPVTSVRPILPHGRNDSTDSINSARSSHRSRPTSATKREGGGQVVLNPTPSSTSTSSIANASIDQASAHNDQPRLINIPPRASSTDAAKRIANPSPLSKPMTMNTESSASKDSFASAVSAALQQPSKPPTYAQVANGKNAASPAAQHLAAVNEKDGKKNKTSRLRRAFSFGSAQELRKASAENSAANNASSTNTTAAERSRLRKEQYQNEQEAEQAKIAARQEAGGIGSGIYSGQGNFFSGSNDNLSISSTASSASIMIRKMGKGMKKSTRSLVGLFRPKSVIGVPAADSAMPHGSEAQVSMVTVEAEREKVNVNVNPHDQAGGGTGYPKLEKNSVDAGHLSVTLIDNRLGSSGTETSARRSIVGGDKERAEVLASVKKGILKRSGTASANPSPDLRPLDHQNMSFQLPQIPNMSSSPLSSAPSTPTDEHRHKKTASVTLGGEDYFMSALRFQGDSKSVPTTPQGTVAKRNATFSPRIQFHDTWPSGEYDRRGEISTCNRLTPMLAQQIKEELNTFKMEMVVHENSKIYTHFF